jgi:adenylate cyclase
MAESIVSAIAPKIFQTEIDLAARRPNNLSAYDLCLRAYPHLYSWTRGGTAEALRLGSRALEIDPRYGFAARVAGSCHFINVNQGWTADPKSEISEGLRLIRLALSIDGNDDVALSILGWATASFSDDYDTAREMGDRAVALNANSAFAWEQRGFTYELAGQLEEAIRSFARHSTKPI